MIAAILHFKEPNSSILGGREVVFKRIKILLTSLLTIVMIFSCFGCSNSKKNQKDPYEGRQCIECGDEAEHSVRGALPFGAKINDSNCDKLGSGLYRIYYCDACWDKMPKADGDFLN